MRYTDWEQHQMDEAYSRRLDGWAEQRATEPQAYEVTCARCGKVGSSADFIVEEGDEWECPPCWKREEARIAGTQAVDDEGI